MSEDDREVQRSLGRLEGKLDAALTRFAIQDTQISALDKRVGGLEKRVWYFSGGAAVLAFIAQHLIGKN